MTRIQKAILREIEYYLPEIVADNSLLVKQMHLDWSAEEIFSKTGIRKRHIVSESECASDLAVLAAEKLFCNEPGLRESIDFLIFCSQNPDYILPSTSCILQKRLGLSVHCGALDINQGCSGFVYGLSVAKGLIESGTASNILLITSETYSKYLEKSDKTTRTIFGDGAAAVWITAQECPEDKIGSFCLGTDGSGAENLILRNSASRKEPGASSFLFMDGPEIFQFTLSTVPKLVKDILSKANLSIDEIDCFVFHQANAFILEHLRKKLKIAPEKFCIDMEETGNTVSASIPIALKRTMEQGRIQQGMKLMIIGFGVGYSWGGCIVKL